MKNTAPHFNSIKVRLERAKFTVRDPGLIIFQFHKGTIRTCGRRELLPYSPNFNSIKVRLERIASPAKA